MRAVRLAIVFGIMFGLVAATFATMASRADDQEADWIAILAGRFETPPRDTHAHGTALFFENADGTLSFMLIVANIENVVAAHIHCGAPGIAGPIGVTLLHAVPPGGGRVDGVLVTGTISAADSGNSCGWTDVASVLAAMATGNTYVNVHTNDGMDGINTGPGDFPGGEIRGQVMPAD